MVELTQVFTLGQCLRSLYGPDFKFASHLSICVISQSHQILCNASIDVRKVCEASQACDGFMQQGPGILFGADFESAFNSVNHIFLYSVLLKFGFDHNYIRWLKLLYNNAKSCVINNGFTTKYFPLERGNRQGDPLYPYLFIMVLEVLASMVRHNDLIQGIKIGE